MTLRYASVCDGIGAVHAAWAALGWTCVWTAEIEPFPAAVVETRWGLPNLGDILAADFVDRAKAHGAIDVLVGGTPCQSFSVAGLRGGLADPRGNLALRFLQLARSLRPTWLVWENVPGVLSSGGGRDFGAILGGLEELGYGWAYRIMDAQYFGVAQRRRRVFAVGCAGDWRRAASVLLERQSLSGHPAPSRDEGAGTAGTLAARVAGGGGLGTDAELGGCLVEGVDLQNYALTGEAAGTVQASIAKQNVGIGVIGFDRAQITSKANYSNPKPGQPMPPLCNGGQPMIAHALSAEGHDTSEDDMGRGTPLIPVAYSVCLGSNPIHSEELAMPQTARHGDPGVVAFADPAYALGVRGNGSDPAGHAQGWNSNFIGQRRGVRRITPLEAERLQGFPDRYTLIDFKGKPAKDGPRYRALGNTMAVPVMGWLGRRIGGAA